MKFYRRIEDFPRLRNVIATIGIFDGVHSGHRRIIERMREVAKERGGETVLVTFNPHPKSVLHKDHKYLKYIHSRSRKIDLLARTGIDYVIEIPFSKAFAQTPAREFIQSFMVQKVGVSHIVVGYDYRFGKGQEGTYEGLLAMGKEWGFSVEQLSAVTVSDIIVSSTAIRSALHEGNVQLANTLLGYEYSLFGEIIYGKQLGRTIGFPTANIEVPNKLKLIAANGVYACRILWKGQKLIGMGNIGFRPTVNGNHRTIEVNIFDFSQEIYGDYLTVYFVQRIRDEKKFQDLDALKVQLEEDQEVVREILKQCKVSPFKA